MKETKAFLVKLLFIVFILLTVGLVVAQVAYAGSTVMKTVLLNGVDGVLAVDLITNASSQPIDVYTAGNAIDIHPASFASYNPDGLVT